MKPILLKNSTLARKLKVNAIILYPFVFFAPLHPDEVLMNHERIHLKQIRDHGILGFYSIYLLDYFRNRLMGQAHDLAYRNIRFEVEAYASQNDLDYLV